MMPALRRHEGNRLADEQALSACASDSMAFAGAEWQHDLKVSPVPDHTDTFDIELTVQVTAGQAGEVSVALAFAFETWDPDAYVLLPAAVYQGNNFQVADFPYPPLWREPAEFRADMPTTITDLPRLGSGRTRLEQSTGDVATPCMGFHSAAQRRGFLLFTTQGTRLGNSGLTVERSGGGARFLLNAPCVREFRQAHCMAVASDDRAPDWQTGDTLTLRARIRHFDAQDVQTLFDRFCDHRKDLNPSGQGAELPFSAAWKLLEEKYNRDNWVETHGYYKLAPNAHTTFEVAENPLCFLWQLGWVGGGMMTLPMLAQGDATTRQRALRNLDMVFRKTQAPSGFFLGSGDGERFYSDSFDIPHPHRLHLIRKSADWLYFALKQFDLLRKLGEPVPAAWLDSIQRLAGAFVRLWDRSGQFGQFVDVETGGLLVGGSANGAVAPAALARAATFYQNPEFLRVAIAAGHHYHANFTRRGLSTGGPGEILSAPDSESAFALLESYVVLFEETGDPFWAAAARDMLGQAATWVVSYNHQFPPDSTLGRSGACSTGAVWANIQNKHGAPGICTFSGDSLLRLWRATGDSLALDLLHDIAHGIPQYVSRPDRPLGEAMQPGWMCERVNLSDWEGAAGVGGQIFGSCSWVETAMMLTTWEIPGLYVQPDTGFSCAFDHITVEKTNHVNGRLELKLTNPTKFDANVKVLCEPSAACQQALGLNALLNARIVRVPAGQSRRETFE